MTNEEMISRLYEWMTVEPQQYDVVIQAEKEKGQREGW